MDKILATHSLETIIMKCNRRNLINVFILIAVLIFSTISGAADAVDLSQYDFRVPIQNKNQQSNLTPTDQAPQSTPQYQLYGAQYPNSESMEDGIKNYGLNGLDESISFTPYVTTISIGVDIRNGK